MTMNANTLFGIRYIKKDLEKEAMASDSEAWKTLLT